METATLSAEIKSGKEQLEAMSDSVAYESIDLAREANAS